LNRKSLTMREAAEIAKRFETVHGVRARVFRAPGRVNLIGEHTDYNGGFVMPAAIDMSTYVAAEARAEPDLVIDSENFGERRQFPLADTEARPCGDWSDYARGVAVALERCGFHLRGANLMIRGGVPIGSGLSSSAALEVAVAQALLALSGNSVPATELARLCQRAENEFVGVSCGIMDQFVCCCARAGHALLLDCRSLDYRMVPLPSDVRLMICDTRVPRQLNTGGYNQRRRECEEGVQLLQSRDSAIHSLRDATLDTLEQVPLPEVIFRRCRHVITENARVTSAAAALEAGDLTAFGRLMGDSHRSLRDDYEVSCQELDLMVRIAEALPGVYGSRMTGAGFGGCTVSLVQSRFAAEFSQGVCEEYRSATGIEPAIWNCQAVDGASEVTPS
jgi:galactokinase